MNCHQCTFKLLLFCGAIVIFTPTKAQVGKRFPSARKEVIDPVTGSKFLFLTIATAGGHPHPTMGPDGTKI